MTVSGRKARVTCWGWSDNLKLTASAYLNDWLVNLNFLQLEETRKKYHLLLHWHSLEAHFFPPDSMEEVSAWRTVSVSNLKLNVTVYYLVGNFLFDVSFAITFY